MTRWLVLALTIAGCKKAPSGGTPTPGSGEHPPDPATGSAAWQLESQAVQPMCGEHPLALPAPASVVTKQDRPLPRTQAITVCQDQASVAAACDCLARSIKDWGPDLGLSPAVQCEPQAPATQDAQVVMVSSKGFDEAATAGGEAFVFVVKRGASWSPVATIEAAPDVDLAVTPKASHTAKVDRVEAHGSIYWIESHHEAQEKEMSDSNRDGEAHGTVCVTGASPWCGQLPLGTWTYAFTPSTSECTITKVTTYAATVDDHAVTLRGEHGSDDAGATGRYTFETVLGHR